MALINKTGITDGGLIQAEHVTRIIDALSGVSTDSIVATGSFSGSLTGALTGTASFAETASFVTGSIFNGSNLATSASFSVSASQTISSSFATRASSSIITQQTATGTYPLVFTNNTVGNNPLYISPAGGGVLYNTQNNTLSNVGGLSGGTATFNTSLTVTGSLRLTGSMTHGIDNVANGLNSYAHGLSTTARGDYSRAEGRETNTGITGAYSASVNSNFSTFSSFTMSAAYGNIADQFSTGDNLYMYYPDNDYAQILPVSRSYHVNPNTIIETNDPAFSTGRHFIVNISIGLLNNSGDQIIPGNYSHAEGQNTTALRNYSHAEGELTEAYGESSHTEGYLTQAYGNYSHAEGDGTIAVGFSSHAEGQMVQANGNYSHAEGREVRAKGYASHAEGYNTTASASFSHAEGYETVAGGYTSHAEGFNTTAGGDYSHAEGELCQVNGFSSHGEGRGSITWGAFSHAEGYETVGRGFASHTEGIRSVTGTAAAYSASLVSGSGAEPRIKVTLSGSYGNVTGLFSNAHTSSLYIRGTVPGNIKSVTIPISRSYYVAPNTIIESNANANEDFGSTIIALHLTGSVLIGNAGIPAIIWAGNQIISGDYAHAEGGTCNGIGYASHAEGESCASLGSNSHAEGVATVACNTAAHSEGYLTRAFGVISHAEGQDTTALGNSSHAEGYQTRANGFASHAEGAGTIAYEDHQLVIGKWNFTGSLNQAFIIGNGTSTSARANAFRVDTSGNVAADGTITPGGADYAEYFESYNAQPIPLGTVVELTGSLIKICENAENAIGVISNKPSILGNSDEGTADEWVGKYEKDIWGNYIMESYEYELPAGISDQGTPLFKTEIGTRKKLNPNYDETVTYVPRSERPEWNVVGLLGQIKVLKNQQIPARWIKMKDINEDIAIYLVR